MDIELVKASIQRLRERRAAIPAMRDYKPQKSGGTKKAATVPADLDSIAGRLSKLFSTPDTETEKGGE